MSETLILALGNPLRRDDGVGPAVSKALKESTNLPGGVVLLDGSGHGLMNNLFSAGYRRMIIIDAADFGGLPGEWKRLTLADIARPDDFAESRGTLHDLDLRDALAIVEALGIALPEIIVYGVQPSGLKWSPGLSEPVQRAVPEICEAIIQEVSEPGSRPSLAKGTHHG